MMYKKISLGGGGKGRYLYFNVRFMDWFLEYPLDQSMAFVESQPYNGGWVLDVGFVTVEKQLMHCISCILL